MFENLPKAPDIQDKLSQFNRTMSDHKLIMAHLGQVCTHLSSVGITMLESAEPLTHDQWHNLLEWAFAGWYHQSKNDSFASFFEAVVKRGINDAHRYMTTATIESVTAEAQKLGWLKGSGKEDDTLEFYWANISQGRAWINSINYQFDRVRDGAKKELVIMAMEKMVIPHELLALKISPEQQTLPFWIEALARTRFPADQSAASEWVENVKRNIQAKSKVA